MVNEPSGTSSSPRKRISSPRKKTSTKKIARKTGRGKLAPPKAPAGKNRLGVTNSLVNNINARKKKGISRAKKKSTITKKSYTNMQNKWGKK